jgi:hypothetical protein
MEKSIYKGNLLRAVLLEAKKNNLKWLLQVSKENVYPNNDDYDDYDNWIYTDNVKDTVKEAEDYFNCVDVIFNNGQYVRYIEQYEDKSCIENISDYTVQVGKDWLDAFINNLEQKYEFN